MSKLLQILGIELRSKMGFLSSLVFVLGTGWDKKAREAIQKIELLSSSLH